MNHHTDQTEFQAKGWQELATHNPSLFTDIVKIGCQRRKGASWPGKCFT